MPATKVVKFIKHHGPRPRLGSLLCRHCGKPIADVYYSHVLGPDLPCPNCGILNRIGQRVAEAATDAAARIGLVKRRNLT